MRAPVAKHGWGPVTPRGALVLDGVRRTKDAVMYYLGGRECMKRRLAHGWAIVRVTVSPTIVYPVIPSDYEETRL